MVNRMSNEQTSSPTGEPNVVKDLCFAAWVVQACAGLRKAPTKEQALKMVEDYFNVEVEEPKAKKKAQVKKPDPEFDKFMNWVREEFWKREGRELTTSELSRFQGKYHYYKKRGNPYEEAFKVKEEKVKSKADGFREWLARHELVKGEPLTEREVTTLKNKWYNRPNKDAEPPVWDNRGKWPTATLKAYDTATGVEVSINGGLPMPWQCFRELGAAQQRLEQLDQWMIQLRTGRTPDEVYHEVMKYAVMTPQ